MTVQSIANQFARTLLDHEYMVQHTTNYHGNFDIINVINTNQNSKQLCKVVIQPHSKQDLTGEQSDVFIGRGSDFFTAFRNVQSKIGAA